ncbi:hypothetical protein H0H93_013707, partial [Arthromyces matolae]
MSRPTIGPIKDAAMKGKNHGRRIPSRSTQILRESQHLFKTASQRDFLQHPLSAGSESSFAKIPAGLTLHSIPLHQPTISAMKYCIPLIAATVISGASAIAIPREAGEYSHTGQELSSLKGPNLSKAMWDVDEQKSRIITVEVSDEQTTRDLLVS